MPDNKPAGGYIDGTLKTGDEVTVPDLNDLERYMLIQITGENELLITALGIDNDEARDIFLSLALGG